MPFHQEEVPCAYDQGWSAASFSLWDKTSAWSHGGHLVSAEWNYWESVPIKSSSELTKMAFLILKNQGPNPGSSVTSIKMYT